MHDKSSQENMKGIRLNLARTKLSSCKYKKYDVPKCLGILTPENNQCSLKEV